MKDSRYEVWAARDDVLCARHRKGEKCLLGVFPLNGNSSLVEVPVAEGYYRDLISSEKITVLRGRISLSGAPVMIEYQER